MKKKELLIKISQALLDQFGENQSAQMARWIIEDLFDNDAIETLDCSQKQIDRAHQITEKLLSGIPFDYAMGYAIFYGLKILVDENVLIPRPETEELVEQAFLYLGKRREEKLAILDIGTGSGCIPIALSKKIKQHAYTAIDISINALKLAEINATNHQVNIEFKNENTLSFSKDFAGRKWDLIISNPPYILKEEMPLMSESTILHEPDIALYAEGDDPLIFYRHIARYAMTNLRPKGLLMIELNEFKVTEIKEIVSVAGFVHTDIKKDLFGKERMMLCYLP